ncbi:MAG: hypothetical protein NZ580_05900 [Bacteroidia bacterium]|nr:hypothetical protein [Bacteroidia bacterium]MDW8236409.1 hypothetical protein [Bacteroidia bacterium]
MTSLRNRLPRLSGNRLVLLLGCWGWVVVGQTLFPPLPAYQAWERGDTAATLRILQQLREHPTAEVRWEAAYLQGHIAALRGETAEALRHWYFVSQHGAGTDLAREAAYRRADLLLASHKDQEAALYLLRSLIEDTLTAPDLRTAAENRLLYYFFYQADLGTLWHLSEKGHPFFYPYLRRALDYQLRQGCFWEAWKLWQQYFVSACETSATVTDFVFPAETLRVVLLLPFMAAQERNSPFLEFWQGFELGLAESRSVIKTWQVRVVDSERNLSRIQELLKEWDSHPPHIIIGDVSWSINQLIADFCERRCIWHAIPMNPTPLPKSYSFTLLTPASCAGERMGEYLARMRDSLGRGICLYETDEPQVSAYLAGMRRYWNVESYPISSNLSELTRQWSVLRDSVSSKDWYMVAVLREEALGFILHKLGRDTLPPLVIGMEPWLQLRHTQLKDYWRIRIQVPQMTIIDSVQWYPFARKVRLQYAQRATFFHAQGYDAARAVVRFWNARPSNQSYPIRYAGILGKFLHPSDCTGYSFRLWQYERGEVRVWDIY